MKVGVLAQEFLINTGANDLLKNFLVALNSNETVELYFIVPPSDVRMEQKIKKRNPRILIKVRPLKKIARSILKLLNRGIKVVNPVSPSEFSLYFDAAPSMRLVESRIDEKSLLKLRTDYEIDVFFPSIFDLGQKLPYITYWPDCQPKHFPEFFDDESQKVRDSLIVSLLNCGHPMIINSQNARGDMGRFYSADMSNIHALPFAPFLPPKDLLPYGDKIQKYGLPSEFFVVCNQFWIHKSIETIFEAIRGTPRSERIPVVFTGRMSEPRFPGYIENLLKKIDDFEISEHVVLLGYISKEDQLAIVSSALAVLQPTLFEGGPGGGSVYDAIALGVPSIVSDIPINREIVSKFTDVQFFKPKDSKSLSELMRRFTQQERTRPDYELLFQSSKLNIELLGENLVSVLSTEADKFK